MLVDTHCHLNFDWFDEDRDEVIKAAEEEGVGIIINPGIDLNSSHNAVKLATESSIVYAAVGVHPNDANLWDTSSIKELKAIAASEKVVAIGEIGLDYYRKYSRKELQKKIFIEQLQLAGELGLPVIIHTRNESLDDESATIEVVQILKDWIRTLKESDSSLYTHPGVLHSYAGSLQHAEEVIAMGFYIGVTGPVTFKNANRLRGVISKLPIEHLLIETDSPFLTPHPYRGKRNEPKYVKIIAEKVSEIYGMPTSEVEKITTRNAEKLFNWKQIT